MRLMSPSVNMSVPACASVMTIGSVVVVVAVVPNVRHTKIVRIAEVRYPTSCAAQKFSAEKGERI